MQPACARIRPLPTLRSTRIVSAWTTSILLVGAARAQTPDWLIGLGTPASDYPQGVVGDGSGGAFVCGATHGALFAPPSSGGGGAEHWVARLDSSGTILWGEQFGAVDATGTAWSVCRDGSGGAFVTGFTPNDLAGPNQGMGDVFLQRLTASGDTAWVRQFGTPADDWAEVVVEPGNGDAIVAGRTRGSLGGSNAGNFDAFLARFAGDGTFLGATQLGTSANDILYDAVCDGFGGVYLCGSTQGALGGVTPSGGLDGWLARFDASGTLLWVRLLGSSGDDVVLAAAVDGAGGVILAGTTTGDLGGPAQAGHAKVLARYDAAGNQLWVRKHAWLGLDQALSLTACSDASGGGFLQFEVEASIGGPGTNSRDVLWAHFDTAGNIDWVTQSGSTQTEIPTAIASGDTGGFLAAGMTFGSFAGPNQGLFDAWVARLEDGCMDMQVYCSPSATSIPGCVPSIAGSGPATLFDPDLFRVECNDLPGGNLGLCVLGASGSASIPFGTLGGVLCIQPPLNRCPPKSSGGHANVCDGSYAYALAELQAAAPAVVVPGADLRVQFWSRDPANPDGFVLSDGLHFTLCP